MTEKEVVLRTRLAANSAQLILHELERLDRNEGLRSGGFIQSAIDDFNHHVCILKPDAPKLTKSTLYTQKIFMRLKRYSRREPPRLFRMA